ncbi:MAG: helix-turn-helix domain-containing protein [Bacteroidota bacterium]
MIAAQQIGCTTTAASPELQPYISAYCLYDFSPELCETPIFFLPEGIIEIVVQLGAVSSTSTATGQNWRQRPDAFVGGLHSRAYIMQIEHPGKAWGIRFKPGAFRRFTSLAVHQFKNLLASPTEIWGKEAEQWLATISKTKDLETLWHMTERFLKDHLNPANAHFPAQTIWAYIQQSKGQCKVAELAQMACLSSAQFRLRFNQYFGIAPKPFLRLYRLQQAQQQFHPQTAFTELAYLSGYYDQAHFNRDIRSITNMSPSELFSLLR